MRVDKAAIVEERVNGLRGDGPHPERALKQVRARAQVLNRAQVFQRMPLFLQRIIARALAHDFQLFRLQFKGLLHFGRKNERAFSFDGRAHAIFLTISR